MPSLADIAQPPSTSPENAAADRGEARLGRLCALLHLAGARLSARSPSGLSLTAQVGTLPDNIGALESRAAEAGSPHVVADTGSKSPGAVRFYAGFVLPADGDIPATLVSLFDTRPRSAATAIAIAALAGDVLAQALLARQRRQIEVQARTIADYSALEEQRRSLFDRASATARIGVWQCNLSDNSIAWTNGVYDLFEMPRNTPVTREIGLSHYTELSRREMEAARSEAIAKCSDFSLDCEIVTAKGNHRWMRLTGAVESRDGVAYRIFGMKQDITEEKLMADRNRYLAQYDVMTGLANRGQFQAHLDRLDAGAGHPEIGALLLVDLDGFKQINDNHGHALGDECIREAAQRLRDCCAGAELVARVGGDEFAVVVNAAATPADIDALAADIVATIRRPLIRSGQRLKLGASVGVAIYAGTSASDLFRQADTALYAAKAAGRGTSRTFVPETRRSA